MPILGWAPWLSYMWPCHQDKEMDKGILRIFDPVVTRERESKKTRRAMNQQPLPNS